MKKLLIAFLFLETKQEDSIVIQNEPQLVKSLSKGNILAFNTLFREYSGRLYRFANGYLKSKTEAEELVQEVFLIIWENKADLKEEFSFKSFLFTIAFNIIKKHFRTRAQFLKYLRSETIDDLDMQTSDEISYNSLYQHITLLANQLPKHRKMIFVKSRFDGLNIKEIARDLNISHKTVENQLTLALKFLRMKLKKEDVITIFFFLLFVSSLIR